MKVMGTNECCAASTNRLLITSPFLNRGQDCYRKLFQFVPFVYQAVFNFKPNPFSNAKASPMNSPLKEYLPGAKFRILRYFLTK